MGSIHEKKQRSKISCSCPYNNLRKTLTDHLLYWIGEGPFKFGGEIFPGKQRSNTCRLVLLWPTFLSLDSPLIYWQNQLVI
jgi:hypothetical protein